MLNCDQKNIILCNQISYCINKELYDLRTTSSSNLTNFCGAAVKCIDHEFFNVGTGAATTLQYYEGSVIKILTNLPGFDDSGSLSLVSVDGDVQWISGSGSGSININPGTGITVSGNGSSGTPFVIASTISQYTDENAQDAVGNILSNEFTYSDSTPLISIANVDWSKIVNAPSFSFSDGNGFDGTLVVGAISLAVASGLNGSILYSNAGALTAVTIGSGLSFGSGTLTNTQIDKNFAEDNLTFDAARTHNASSFALTINNIDIFTTNSINGTALHNLNSLADNSLLFGDNNTYISYLRPSSNDGHEISLGETGIRISSIDNADPTGLYIPRLQNVSTQDRIIGLDEATGQIGNIVVGSGLLLSGGTLSANGTPSTGGSGYIQNQFAGPQSSSDFWISGNGRVNGYLQINNAGRIVTDSSTTVSITTAASSTTGADLRLKRLQFFVDGTPTSLATSNIFADSSTEITLEASSKVYVSSPILSFSKQNTDIDLGGFFPLTFTGASGSVGQFDFIELYNNNTVGVAGSDKVNITFTHNRTTGGKTEIAKIGSNITNTANSGYQGDLVFYTANGTTPAEQMRLSSTGLLTLQNIPNASIDTDKFLVSDSGIIKYRTAAQMISDFGLAISDLRPAAASNTINNGNFKQEWQWNTLATGNSGLKLAASTSSGGTNDIRLFESSLSGTHSSSNGTRSYAGYFSNTRNGSGTESVGIYATASGGSNGANFSAYLDGFVQIIGDAEIRQILTLRNNNNYTTQLYTHPSSEGLVVHSPYTGNAASRGAARFWGVYAGAPAVGFGVQAFLESYNSASLLGVSTPMSRIESVYTVVTPGSESTDFIINTRTTGGLSEKFKIFSNGTIRFNNTFTFPSTDGTNGQALVTNGSGTVSWATIGGGGGTPTLQQVLTSGSLLTTDNTINVNNNDFIFDNVDNFTLEVATDTFLKIAAFGSATNGDVLTLVDNTTGEVGWTAGGGGGGGVSSFSAGNLSPLFTSNVATATTTPALTFSLTNAAGHTYFGNNTASAGAPAYRSNAALTKVDDTNVTLTLGGAPTTSLLEAVSLTIGWTGTLGVARGGTNIASYTVADMLYATGGTTLSKLAIGTAGQQLRVNAGATAPEWFTPSGSGITSLNGLGAATQTFAVGTTGSDFNISSVTSTHTFNIPSASASARGLVTTGAQVFEGVKTHNVGTIINETGADSDTRIEGDTQANLLFVDASTDRIGIATATPLSLLHLSAGANSITATIDPILYVDAGASNSYGAEFKGSNTSTGILVTNTSGSGLPFYQLHNTANNKFWTQTLDTDNGFSIKEGASGGTTRLKFAASSGTITATGNLALINKINLYNNTAIIDGQLLMGNTATGTFDKGTITGTVNRVSVTNGAGTILLNLPQDIHTAANVQFSSLGLGVAATAGGAILNVTGNAGGSATTAGIAATPQLSPTANQNAYGITTVPTITRTSTGTHTLFAALYAPGFNVSIGGGAPVTNTAGLYVGASSGTVTGANYSIWSFFGANRFDGATTFNGGVNFGNTAISNYTGTFNNQTGTTYTLVPNDTGKILTISNASPITLTVPTGLPVGFNCTVVQLGAGQITFVASGTTINNRNSFTKTAGIYAVASIISLTSTVFVTGGDMA